MIFAHPEALWLLVVVGGLAVLDGLQRTAAQLHWPNVFRLRAHEAKIELLPATAGREIRWRLWLGLALVVGALASPRAGHVRQPAEKAPREVVVAMDLSRSMLARDVKPSRLDHAKLLTAALIEKTARDRLGLVLFSATAYAQLPLSNDYQIFSEMLANLSPDYFPQSGTNFGAMLTASLATFGKTSEAERFLVVLSDGEAFDAEWKAALPELKRRGIRVIGIGIGTRAGSVLATDDGLVRTPGGGEVVSRLNASTLQELANATGGTFAAGTSWVDIAALLTSPPEAQAKAITYTVDPTRLVERYRWLVVPALLLLAWSFCVELPVRPASRTVRLPTPSKPTKTAATAARSTLVAVALLMPLVLLTTPVLQSQDVAEEGERDEADERSPTRSLAAMVSQRISGMLVKPKIEAPDCVSLVIDIIAYCENTLRARQRFPLSIIDDARHAIALGERLDPQGGNWQKLRSDLDALQKAVQEPWKTARPDKAGTTDVALGYDPGSEMKEDKLSAGLRASDPSDADELANAKSSFADNSAFGAMGGQPREPREPEPPPASADEQVIGGKKTSADEEREEHPELVLPLQKLEHVRRGDTPAKLFQMLEGKRSHFVPNSPEW